MPERTVQTGDSVRRGVGVPGARTTLIDTELNLSSTGTPDQPIVLVDLDSLRDAPREAITRAAAAARRALPLVVGLLQGPPANSLSPLLDAATLSLTDRPGSDLPPQLISVPDLEHARVELTQAVERCPQAAVACGQLLRQTVRQDTTRALAAEAAVYSMLLSGNEFARWLSERGPSRHVSQPERDLVRLERLGRHLAIILDHPERRNALSARLREELLAAMQVAVSDPTIDSVDLSGTGPVFCSGGDLDEFGTASDLVAAYLVRLDRAPWRLMDELTDRLTVRVRGACAGAGVELMAFANTVAAEQDASFVLPEVRMGLVPGAGGSVSIPRRIGRWRAAWLMLTGQRLSAATALRWGLIDEVI
ncbi:enoyl-CoA hydratase/isomerase family protein [Nocardia goodfellowii]